MGWLMAYPIFPPINASSGSFFIIEGDLQWLTGRKAFTPWHQQTGLEILEGTCHLIWGGHVHFSPLSHVFILFGGILQFIKQGPYIVRWLNVSNSLHVCNVTWLFPSFEVSVWMTLEGMSWLSTHGGEKESLAFGLFPLDVLVRDFLTRTQTNSSKVPSVLPLLRHPLTGSNRHVSHTVSLEKYTCIWMQPSSQAAWRSNLGHDINLAPSFAAPCGVLRLQILLPIN